MIHYLILTHKSPEQLSLLVEKLSSPFTKIYVHVDGYTPIDSFLCLSDKVEFVRKRIKIRWGGFSIIQATLNGFSQILPNMKNGDHAVVMSGQDLPIKTQKYISDFLSKYPEKSFLEYKIQPNEDWNILNRVVKYHFHDLVIPSWINAIFHKVAGYFYNVSGLRNQIFCYIYQRFVNLFLPRKKYLLKHYDIYWGSQWQVLCKNHLEYIVKFCLTSDGKKTIKAFKTTAGPDELFLQTVLLNSPYKKNMINQLLWYIDWKKGPGLPRVLDMSDLKQLQYSDKLFARKFDVNIDKDIFNAII